MTSKLIQTQDDEEKNLYVYNTKNNSPRCKGIKYVKWV